MEEGWFIDFIVDLGLNDEVGYIVDGVVVAGVLVIYEYKVIVALLNQYVVCQEIVVREDQAIFLVFAGELVDKEDFLLGCPLLQLGYDWLLFR